MERWCDAGPAAGRLAPPFDLEATDGTRYKLIELRGRPVVIEFGSYTCPVFCGHIRAMEQLARIHHEVNFLVVYTREGHPGEKVEPHRTMDDKLLQALRLVLEDQVARPVLVDGRDGRVHRAYGGGWDPVFVLDSQGRVVLRRFWNDPAVVNQVLRDLARGLAVVPRESVEFSPPLARRPAGLELLERGGVQALLDVYRSAPPAIRSRIEASESTAVRTVLARAAGLMGDLHERITTGPHPGR